MHTQLALNDLLDYTAWERQKWHEWLRQHGDDILKVSAGPHGDGRFATVGDLMRHIFSAETRYVDRLSGKPLTDTASIPNDKIEALFQFGERSRKDLREFLETYPDEKWDISEEHKLGNHVLYLTPRKIVVHIVIHEIRHWAQIATLLRLNGFSAEFHDFLFSSVMAGEKKPTRA